MALRKNMKRRIARNQSGKITCGHKVNGKPRSLDYFNISKFPELVAEYGEKPKELVVFFPSNNIEDFFFTEYSLWGSKGGEGVKLRACDGETARDMKTGEVKGCFCVELAQKEQCKSYTSLKAFVAKRDGIVVSPVAYQFENHSDNSSDNVYSELEKIWQLTGGRLIGIPFVMSVKFVKKAGGQQFPIWELASLNSIETLVALAYRATIPTTVNNALPVDTSADILALDSPEPLAIDPPAEAEQPETVFPTGEAFEAGDLKVKENVVKVIKHFWPGASKSWVDLTLASGRSKEDKIKHVKWMCWAIAKEHGQEPDDVLMEATRWPREDGSVGEYDFADLSGAAQPTVNIQHAKVEKIFIGLLKEMLEKQAVTA